MMTRIAVQPAMIASPVGVVGASDATKYGTLARTMYQYGWSTTNLITWPPFWFYGNTKTSTGQGTGGQGGAGWDVGQLKRDSSISVAHS